MDIGGTDLGKAVREVVERGDAPEMRRLEARLRKWLKGTYELVDDLEQVIVELEEPRR
jgi:hypothetical protein